MCSPPHQINTTSTFLGTAKTTHLLFFLCIVMTSSNPLHNVALSGYALNVEGCVAGVLVEDAAEAHQKATAHGAVSVVEPVKLRDEASGTEQVVSEVNLYGDVVLRFVSGSYQVRPGRSPRIYAYLPVLLCRWLESMRPSVYW